MYYGKAKISAGTIARTICLALALVNLALSTAGKPLLPIKNEQIESAVTVGFTAVSGIMSWWKNNSFTKEAIEADKIMRSQKERNTWRH